MALENKLGITNSAEPVSYTHLVPTVEVHGPQVRKRLAPQGLQAEKESENVNVRNAGWLHSFDADYHYRGSNLHYHVNVSAALSEGGTVW